MSNSNLVVFLYPIAIHKKFHYLCKMKRIILFLICLTFGFGLQAQIKLSDDAYVTLLTGGATQEESFTVYGHTAIRVVDPILHLDYLFNYGIFDFSKPHFIYRFAKGQTDYKLGINRYADYVKDCQRRGASLKEQQLNLTPSEVRFIWGKLVLNAAPENAVYRYNFFFDNCATRPAKLIEKSLGNRINYDFSDAPKTTFRQMINHCTRFKPWLTFGCDLVLGMPTDNITEPKEQFFLPAYLNQALDHTTIKDFNGKTRPLVKSERLVVKAKTEASTNSGFTPSVVGFILLLIVLMLTRMDWKTGKWQRTIDFTLFLLAGMAGSLLAFIAFASEHPCVSPNLNLLWLHPFHLAGAVLFCVKRWKIPAFYYHFINFAALCILIVCWILLPQHVNITFIPLVLCLMVRSLYALRHKYVK